MKLEDWSRLQGLTVTRLAELVGVDKSTISRILTGKTTQPKRATAKAIVKLTDGAVTMGDLYA